MDMPILEVMHKRNQTLDARGRGEYRYTSEDYRYNIHGYALAGIAQRNHSWDDDLKDYRDGGKCIVLIID